MSRRFRRSRILPSCKWTILCRASYEVHQHRRVAERVGVAREKIDAVEMGAEATVYTALEKLVLRFTDEVVQNVKASDALFSELLSHLGNRSEPALFAQTATTAEDPGRRRKWSTLKQLVRANRSIIASAIGRDGPRCGQRGI